MALTSGKPTQQGTARSLLSLGITAAAVMFQGGMAMLSSGYARAARAGQGGNDFAKMDDAALSRVAGVGLASLTGGGSNGAVLIDAQLGDWLFKNSAGVDAITVADILRYCFVADDETVAKTSASGTRPRAGVVLAVDSTGVLVRISPEGVAGADRVHHLPFFIDATDLSAGTSQELIAPCSGTILRATAIVQTAIVTGGDITVKNVTTDVAGLTLTLADAAGKGTVVTDTPTAGDATTAVTAGQRIQIVPAAAFNAGGAVRGILSIGY